MKKESQVIFDKNVIEFVTVAAEFCAFLERAESMKRSTFVDTTLKILPLLYLKASMLPKCEMIGDESPETYVTEEIYEVLRINLASILAEKDDYLSGYQRLYLRIPAGIERDDERFPRHLPRKLRTLVGTKTGKHHACPA